MKFVECYEGGAQINLDHVARLEPVRGKLACDAYGADGEKLGRIDSDIVDSLEPATIVPETTGRAVLVVFYLEGSGVLWSERLPVMAWRIGCGEAEPVTCNELDCDNSTWCLELREAGGNPYAWVFPGGRTCETEADARKSAEKDLTMRAKLFAA